MSTLDVRFGLKPQIPLSEFPSLLSRYIDDWLYERYIKDVNKSERKQFNKYQSYADHVGLPESLIIDLCSFEHKTIPTEILKDMGIAIAVADVPIYSFEPNAVVVRDDS